MAQRKLRTVGTTNSDDPLCIALSVLVNRDLVNSAMYPTEDADWTPLTVQFAERLRALDRERKIWDEEPDLVRGVLDGAWT